MRDFEFYVNAIIENKHMNGGKWSDWPHPCDVFEAYGAPDEEGEIALITGLLDCLIKNDCPTALLRSCFSTWDLAIWGIEKSREWLNHL